MDPANTKALKDLGQVMRAAVKSIGFITEQLAKRGLTSDLTKISHEDHTLVYSAALLKACTRIIEQEEEIETLREEIRRGPSATLRQEEVAVDGMQKDEWLGSEGLAGQDVQPSGRTTFLHRIQEPGRRTNPETDVHHI